MGFRPQHGAILTIIYRSIDVFSFLEFPDEIRHIVSVDWVWRLFERFFQVLQRFFVVADGRIAAPEPDIGRELIRVFVVVGLKHFQGVFRFLFGEELPAVLVQFKNLPQRNCFFHQFVGFGVPPEFF